MNWEEGSIPRSLLRGYSLAGFGVVSDSDVVTWDAIIGLRNRIVLDYTSIDMSLVIELLENEQFQFVTDFLLRRYLCLRNKIVRYN